MNLWIILAITWISVSAVIADPGWFVQDIPLLGETNDDLFSSEHLLVVKPKPKSKPKATTTVKVNKDPHSNVEKPKTKSEQKPKTPAKPVKKVDNDVESESFIPVHGTGRKPLAVDDKHGKIITMTAKSNILDKKPSEKSKQPDKKSDHVLFVQEVSQHEDDDDLSSEHLLAVKTKTKPKPKATTSTEPNTNHHENDKSKRKPAESKHKPDPKPVHKTSTDDVQSENLIPVQNTGRRPLAAIQKQVETEGTPRTEKILSPSQSEEDDDLPCEDERDIDCLMETEELILVDKKTPSKPNVDHKPLIKREDVAPVKQQISEEKKVEPAERKVEEIQRAALHRRLLDNDKKSSSLPKQPVQQPLIYEVKEEEEGEWEEEDILANEEKQGDAIIRRLKRQTNEDFGSGGGGDFESTASTSDFTSIPFTTTLNKTYTELNDTERDRITREAARQFHEQFQNFTGYQDTIIRNVSLDENGRVVIDWGIIVSVSGAPGQNNQRRLQNTLNFLENTVVPANNELTVFGNPVFGPSQLDGSVVRNIAGNRLQDVCLADDPCPSGYQCVNSGTQSFCQHLCYNTGLIDQCRNGASCQLRNNRNRELEAYCQCGNDFNGQYCENSRNTQRTQYSDGQIIGAGVAGGIAVTGLTCGLIYCALFRKKKEKDSEYSYFGDDDSSQPAFSDANSSLGISNYYDIEIPRPRITPLDLYNGNGHPNGAFA